MSEGPSSRRLFLKQSALGTGGLLLAGLLPETLLAAHKEAHAAAVAGEKFTFLTAEEAADVRAFASQIFPTDDTPGANEANVVYFIDHVLTKYEPGNQEDFRECLKDLNTAAAKTFPNAGRFGKLTPEQQLKVMEGFQNITRKRRADLINAFFGGVSNPFESLRSYVIAGFLSDPELGGNKDMVGWQLLGFDGMGMHEPPFGFYDAELLKQKVDGE